MLVVLPEPFRGMGAVGTVRKYSSQATSQGLDQRSERRLNRYDITGFDNFDFRSLAERTTVTL